MASNQNRRNNTQSEWVNNIFGTAANVVNSITSIFGVDIRKFLKKWDKKNFASLDYTSALSAINKAFGQLEIDSAQKLNNITKRLENLIQMPNSPTMKKFLNNIKNDLTNAYSKVTKQQAENDLKKVQAQNLANDIDTAGLGDMGSKDYNKKAGQLEDLVSEAVNKSNDPNKTRQEVSNVPGWEHVDLNV